MSLSTSIVNGANTAYQTVAHASAQGFVWLKGAAAATANGAVKLAGLAKDFFAQALTQGYNLSQTYASIGLKLAKANPFVAGAALGTSAGIALTLLAGKFRASAAPTA